MKSEDLIGALLAKNIPVFTSFDAACIINKNAKYTALFLGRLAGSGKIKRIERGKYYVADTDIYSVASNIICPSYISLFAALRFHGITTQIITTIDVVSLKRHAAISSIEGQKINFIKLDHRRFFGFYRERSTNAFVAYTEKALIDALYLQNPPLEYVGEALAAALEDNKLDTGRLMQFAMRMDSNVLIKRVIKLCASLGLDDKNINQLSEYGQIRIRA